MEQKRKSSKVAEFISTVYIIAAVVALLHVCGYCYPNFAQRVRETVAGEADSPVVEAFSTLADGLGAGYPLKETVIATFEVLMEDAV